MTTDELIAVLRLQNIPNIGDVSAKKLIAHCGSPFAIFNDKLQNLLKIDGIGTFTIKGLHDTEHFEAAEKELQYIQDHDIAYSYFTDNDYPRYLKHCIDGPLIIFKKGNIDFEERKIISIVGTRNITSYGTAFCEKLIEDLAPLDPIIVSGFAYGVDICAQKTAIKHGLQTIGCLAHGLNQIYPKIHSKFVPNVEKMGVLLLNFGAPVILIEKIS